MTDKVDEAAMRCMQKECANSNYSFPTAELERMFADMVKGRPVKTNPATHQAMGEPL